MLGYVDSRKEKVALTGHSSAASLPTGPVMAEPFISPLGLTICKVKISQCHSIELANGFEWRFQPHSEAKDHRSNRIFQGTRTTPALSSKYRKTPSNRFQGLACRTMTAGWTFFRSSGFPFLTVAMTMSPTPPAGRRFRRAPIPLTEMMYRLRAPELSAQFMTAPTGRPRVILSLPPGAPRLYGTLLSVHGFSSTG